MKSQITTTFTAVLIWDLTTDLVERSSAVEQSIQWTDWKQHQTLLNKFIDEVTEARQGG